MTGEADERFPPAVPARVCRSGTDVPFRSRPSPHARVTVPMASDDELMRRYADGDVGAFERLYDRYEGRVYGFCLRRLGDRDAAADAFQDAWRRVVDARRRYEPEGKFESWLFTLVRRACIDLRRSRPDAEERDADPFDESVPTPADRSPAADERTVRREELRRLLDRLTEEQREALLLSKYEGFSYREVAEITGSTEAAVKQTVYRALKKLRGER